jgi:hypothetical protein
VPNEEIVARTDPIPAALFDKMMKAPRLRYGTSAQKQEASAAPSIPIAFNPHCPSRQRARVRRQVYAQTF